MKIIQTKDTMHEIYLDALRIRSQVFMKEQGVPVEQEIDQNEPYAVHFVCYEEKQPIGTLRLLPQGTARIKLQRLAVLRPFRHQGYEDALIAAAEQFARAQGFTEVEAEAAVSDRVFYEAAGYSVSQADSTPIVLHKSL